MFAYAAQAEIKDLGTRLDLEITQFPGATGSLYAGGSGLSVPTVCDPDRAGQCER